jgi:hypothetical protein
VTPIQRDMDLTIRNVRLAGQAEDSRWDISCSNGLISKVSPTQQKHNATAPFMTKSLCHPHIHLDKCFLLSHPRFKDLKIQKGDFAEALELTSMSSATCFITKFRHHSFLTVN